MPVDHKLIRALHVDTLSHGDLAPEHDPHIIFQTSTIDALLDGAYDGDVTVAELSRHGDIGLGTFDACDGELIVLDGIFYRARIDGTIEQVGGDDRSPFAVMITLEPDMRIELERPLDQAELLERVDARTELHAACYALRIDGRFEHVEARSVARQHKPYRPLMEVVAGQNVFELRDVEGTMVGFRFPDYAQGINVPGYHLHFIDTERRRGGHVLDFRIAAGSVAVDHSSELHLELPPDVELGVPDTSAAKRDAVRKIEGG